MQPRAPYPYNTQPNYSPQNFYPAPNRPDKKTINGIIHREANRIIPDKRGSTWGSLMLKPELTFANQNPDEKVYVLVKRHWLANLGWFVRNIFYSLIPVFVIIFLTTFKVDISFISPRVIGLGLIIYYSFIFTNVIMQFIDWYYDPFIVTNERIVYYDFKPFSNYRVGEMALENIEDITQTSSGIWGELFNYGNLVVLSENSTSRISFVNIPNPTKVRDIITDLSKIAKTYRYGN